VVASVSTNLELAAAIEARMLREEQEQQVRRKIFLGFLASQAGLSQTNSHLGRGHKLGFLHFQSHLVSSHIGVQTGSGATQEVRQLAGEQTVSHLGQSFFSHMSLGQRTLHLGLSQ